MSDLLNSYGGIDMSNLGFDSKILSGWNLTNPYKDNNIRFDFPTLKLVLSDIERKEIDDRISFLNQKIEDTKNNIKTILKQDFKDFTKIDDYKHIIKKSETEIKDLKSKLDTGYNDDSVKLQGIIGGFNSQNFISPGMISNWNSPSHNTSSIDSNSSNDFVIVKTLDDDLNFIEHSVLDDIFISGLNKHYLRKHDGSIIYLNPFLILCHLETS